MKRTSIACLVPGRARGDIELDPARSGPDSIMLLHQDQLDRLTTAPRGLVLLDGAPCAHAVIQWLGRDLPVARMPAEQAVRWHAGEAVMLDTTAGELRAAAHGATWSPWQPPPAPVAGAPVRMADGTPVHLTASVAGPGGVRRALAYGAAAIGLVRSEYVLSDNGSAPDVAFYRQTLTELLTLAAPLTVTIRLPDLAADKWPPWLLQAADAPDAARGLHGSRLYDCAPVKRVLDALLAALGSLDVPAQGVGVIWPSGGRLEDFCSWRDSVRRGLPSGIGIGAMVETPLEFLSMPRWLAAADFVSVGSNDLLHHLYGIDRDDPRQGHLLDPYRPELFRLLGSAASAASTDPTRVRLCGLLPQVDGVLPALVGLGYRRFSGEPSMIPLLAQNLSHCTLQSCKRLAGAVCDAGSGQDVRALLGVPQDGPWGLVRDLQAAGIGA